jgi:hypothetical protein
MDRRMYPKIQTLITELCGLNPEPLSLITELCALNPEPQSLTPKLLLEDPTPQTITYGPRTLERWLELRGSRCMNCIGTRGLKHVCVSNCANVRWVEARAGARGDEEPVPY